MLVNGLHYWPVIQRFLTWLTSAHLFPLCRIVPSRSVKTLDCINIFRFTFDSLFSFCQWCHPPLYVAVRYNSILYVGSRVAWLYRLFHLLWFGTWRFSYLYDQTSSCTILDQLSICDTWTLIQTCISGPCSDDSLCTFSSAILVYMLDLFSTFHMMYFLTEHGYARLNMSWVSVFFHWFLAGWNLVKSSLVLAKFFLCA